MGWGWGCREGKRKGGLGQRVCYGLVYCREGLSEPWKMADVERMGRDEGWGGRTERNKTKLTEKMKMKERARIRLRMS